MTSDIDDNDKPFLTGERTVEGFYRSAHGLDQAISRGLAYAPYADLVWCETGKPDLEFAKAVRRGDPRQVPRQAARLQLLAVFQLEEEPRRRDHRQVPARARRDGLQVPVHHAGRLPRLNYSMFNLAHGYARGHMTRVRRAAGSRVRRRRQGLHGGQAPARSRHRLLRRGDHDHPGQPGVDHGAQGLDRRRAVLRRWPTHRAVLDGSGPRGGPLFFVRVCHVNVGAVAWSQCAWPTLRLPIRPPRPRLGAPAPAYLLRAGARRGDSPAVRVACARRGPALARPRDLRRARTSHACLSRRCRGGTGVRPARHRRALAASRRVAALRHAGCLARVRCGLVAPSEVPETLLTLHQALHEALIGAAFPLESRPFRPHVTLARRCVQPHPRTRCAPIHWPVARLSLIGSELRPEGPLHTTIAEWALKASD